MIYLELQVAQKKHGLKYETQKYEFEIFKIKASMELSLHLAFSSEASICRCSKAVWITSFVT